MKKNPKEIASLFFSEMSDWERWSLSLERNELSDKARLNKLNEIFKKYLSKKALEKGQSRCEILMFGEPPEYELQITKVEELSDKKQYVYAQGDGWEPEKRYVFSSEDNEWRIEYREYLGSSGKWIKERDL